MEVNFSWDLQKEEVHRADIILVQEDHAIDESVRKRLYEKLRAVTINEHLVLTSVSIEPKRISLTKWPHFDWETISKKIEARIAEIIEHATFTDTPRDQPHQVSEVY